MGWHMEAVVTTPLAHHSTVEFLSWVGHASSRGVPSHKTPNSFLLCCIHAANRGPLLIHSLTPCFRTQPLSVLVDFHLRKGTQSWFPRRLWGGWCLGHGGPCRQRNTWLEGQESQLWWLPLPVPLETDGGKGVAIVLHSASTPCFYGVPGFSNKLSYSWSSLLQFHQEQFHQGTAVPSLDRCFHPHFSATSPPPQQET